MILTDLSWSRGSPPWYIFYKTRDFDNQMKLGMRSHDEIKLHHESIKTSLFISAVYLITICSTEIIKRFLNRKIFSHDLYVHLMQIHWYWSARKVQSFRINLDMQQRKTGKFKARFHVNNPNYNKLASGILRSLLLFICL